MKFRWLEPFKEWFGYSRRERRASFILLILILAVAGARFVIPAHKITVERIAPPNLESRADSAEKKIAIPVAYKWENRPFRSTTPDIIELNRCDSASLEALPGIGPVLSARIIKFRNLLGGYASVDQLREVYGLTEDTYNIISGRLSADTSAVRKIKVNTAEYKQLIKLPYFTKEEVSSILKYRESKGRIGGMKELIDNRLVSEEKAGKVRLYLEF